MKPGELYPYIEKNQPNICQISVRRSGGEIRSAEWNEYKRTDCAHVASVTKSVVSLLVGIAIDHGMLDRVDFIETILLPSLLDSDGEKTNPLKV